MGVRIDARNQRNAEGTEQASVASVPSLNPGLELDRREANKTRRKCCHARRKAAVTAQEEREGVAGMKAPLPPGLPNARAIGTTA